MCLVIDANALSKVFDSSNSEHARFKPVAVWVTTGTGSVVWGGSKYIKELGKGRYLRFFGELTKANRAVMVDTAAVDERARRLRAKVPDKEFNDPHIVALVGVSRCCLVCTDDTESLPYLRRNDLYPDGVRAPHIYRQLKDAKHCSSRLIVDICPKRAAASRRGKKPKARPVVETMR